MFTRIFPKRKLFLTIFVKIIACYALMKLSTCALRCFAIFVWNAYTPICTAHLWNCSKPFPQNWIAHVDCGPIMRRISVSHSHHLQPFTCSSINELRKCIRKQYNTCYVASSFFLLSPWYCCSTFSIAHFSLLTIAKWLKKGT